MSGLPSAVGAPGQLGEERDVTFAGVRRVQRRTFGVVLTTQVIGGFGGEMGTAVGGLLIAGMSATPSLSGLAYFTMMTGSALLALPIAFIMARHGRRPGLAMAYATAATGAAVIVLATMVGSVPLVLAGMLLFGAVTVGNLQSRYAAVDLSRPAARGRRLSVLVWVMTVGAVLGPNLTATADGLGQRIGLPAMAGPFAVSAVVLLAGAVVFWSLLRPDPLLLARAIAERPDEGAAVPSMKLGAMLRVVRVPGARLGIAAAAIGHLVTIGVMAMTPIHLAMVLDGGRASNEEVLRTAGLVLGLSIAGAYGAAPLAGWITDRWGRYPVIVGGGGLLLAACALAGSAGGRTAWLAVGLTLLGLGWCWTVVAGSALLADSVPVRTRPLAQGLSDMIMCLSGAIAAALGGVVVGFAGFPLFTVLLAGAVVFLLGMAFRMTKNRRATEMCS
jgi:MFS family permease